MGMSVGVNRQVNERVNDAGMSCCSQLLRKSVLHYFLTLHFSISKKPRCLSVSTPADPRHCLLNRNKPGFLKLGTVKSYSLIICVQLVSHEKHTYQDKTVSEGLQRKMKGQREAFSLGLVFFVFHSSI